MTHAVKLRAGGLHFVMDVNDVVEIVRESPLKRLPTTPERLEGLMNYRGRLIPVVRLTRLLDDPQAGGGVPRILILRHADRTLGLLVDNVEGVDSWPSTSMSSDVALDHVSDTALMFDGMCYHVLQPEVLVEGISDSLSM